jgi:hypothetical protein
MVNGRGGIDKNIVSFRASKGERVDVSTPAQQKRFGVGQAVISGQQNISVMIVTPDADSFGRSRRQVGMTMKAIMG